MSDDIAKSFVDVTKEIINKFNLFSILYLVTFFATTVFIGMVIFALIFKSTSVAHFKITGDFKLDYDIIFSSSLACMVVGWLWYLCFGKNLYKINELEEENKKLKKEIENRKNGISNANENKLTNNNAPKNENVTNNFIFPNAGMEEFGEILGNIKKKVE